MTELWLHVTSPTNALYRHTTTNRSTETGTATGIEIDAATGTDTGTETGDQAGGGGRCRDVY